MHLFTKPYFDMKMTSSLWNQWSSLDISEFHVGDVGVLQFGIHKHQTL